MLLGQDPPRASIPTPNWTAEGAMEDITQCAVDTEFTSLPRGVEICRGGLPEDLDSSGQLVYTYITTLPSGAST